MYEITNAEQITWQRQAAILLGRILKHAAENGLPAIHWSVDSAGSGLTGDCNAYPHTLRLEHFAAWKAALAALASCGPDQDHEHFADSAGETRLIAAWRHVPLKAGPGRYPAPRVALVASIWPDDDDEEGSGGG
jgi:hypothetical protein